LVQEIDPNSDENKGRNVNNGKGANTNVKTKQDKDQSGDRKMTGNDSEFHDALTMIATAKEKFKKMWIERYVFLKVDGFSDFGLTTLWTIYLALPGQSQLNHYNVLFST